MSNSGKFVIIASYHAAGAKGTVFKPTVSLVCLHSANSTASVYAEITLIDHAAFGKAGSFDSTYTMSVKISDDDQNVLIGVPYFDNIFLLAIDLNGRNLSITKIYSKRGSGTGFAKIPFE